MTQGQAGTVCPRCGSAAAVHSIGELAELARSQLGVMGQQTGPGYPGQAQAGPGYPGQPQAGPGSGWGAEPQAGPLPGGAQPQAGPQPGWAAQPQAGPLPGAGGRRPSRPRPSVGDGSAGDVLSSLGDDLAGAAFGAAAGFLGRAISRRVQRTVTERVLPAMAARQEGMLRQQIEIAERHPDLRACLNDQVIFLAGGSRVLPMPDLANMPTAEQADVMVAQLRQG